MRSALTDVVHVLLQWPAWIVAALLLATLRSFIRPAPAWRRLLLPFVTATAYVASIPASMSQIAAWIEAQAPVPSSEDIARFAGGQPVRILVLSGGWFRLTESGYVAVLGAASWERVAAGVTLWKTTGGKIYFSGAPQPDGGNSVAREMARVALQMGVPVDAIGIEERSTNTRENIVLSAAQFGLEPGTRVMLVTSAVHMPRALAAAKAAAWQVLPVPCDFRADTELDWRSFVPSNDAPTSMEGLLHEALGLLQYRWRGWL